MEPSIIHGRRCSGTLHVLGACVHNVIYLKLVSMKIIDDHWTLAMTLINFPRFISSDSSVVSRNGMISAGVQGPGLFVWPIDELAVSDPRRRLQSRVAPNHQFPHRKRTLGNHFNGLTHSLMAHSPLALAVIEQCISGYPSMQMSI